MKDSYPDPEANKEVEKDPARRTLKRLRILLLLWLLSFLATIIWFSLSAGS
jgi:hypothetical protein